MPGETLLSRKTGSLVLNSSERIGWDRVLVEQVTLLVVHTDEVLQIAKLSLIVDFSRWSGYNTLLNRGSTVLNSINQVPVTERADSLLGRKLSGGGENWLSVGGFEELSVGADNGSQSWLGRLMVGFMSIKSAEKVAIIAARLTLVASRARLRAFRLTTARSGFAALFGAARSFDENILSLELSEVFLNAHRLRDLRVDHSDFVVKSSLHLLELNLFFVSKRISNLQLFFVFRGSGISVVEFDTVNTSGRTRSIIHSNFSGYKEVHSHHIDGTFPVSHSVVSDVEPSRDFSVDSTTEYTKIVDSRVISS